MRMDEIGWHSIHDAGFENERLHGSGDWVFLLIKSPCVILTDGEMRQFPAYTWVLFTPDSHQKYGADHTEYYDDWMHFEPDESEAAMLKALQIPVNTPIPLPKGTEISKILRDMCFEFYSTHLHRSDMTDLYFRMLFYRLHEQLVRIHAVPETENLADRLHWIKEAIYRKPFDKFTASRFAEELNLTEDAFLQQYEAQNGSTFPDDLVGTKMQYIAAQMREHLADNQTVEEIAQLTGFANEDEFSALFAKHIGCTPQEHLDKLRA